MSKSGKRFYDELTTSSGKARAGCKTIHKWISRQDQASWNTYSAAAELAVKEMGISYTLYSEGENIDRAWPFDVVPRLMQNRQWKKVSEGIKQRAKALNLFIDDVYNEQAILRDEVVPAPLVLDSPNFRHQCVGMSPKHRAWATIIGMDLIRDELGHIYVLEDNMRIPSGRKCSTCIRDGESVLTYFARKKIWHGKGRTDAIPRTSPERKRIESCHGNQTPSPMPPLTLTPSQTATSKQPLDAISSSTGQSLKRTVDTSESPQSHSGGAKRDSLRFGLRKG
mgnify:CR=1 FL=1